LLLVFSVIQHFKFHRNQTPEELVDIGGKIATQNIVMVELYGAIEPFRVVLDGEEFTQNPLEFVQEDNWFGTSKVAIMGNNIEEMNVLAELIPSWLTLNKLKFQV